MCVVALAVSVCCSIGLSVAGVLALCAVSCLYAVCPYSGVSSHTRVYNNAFLVSMHMDGTFPCASHVCKARGCTINSACWHGMLLPLQQLSPSACPACLSCKTDGTYVICKSPHIHMLVSRLNMSAPVVCATCILQGWILAAPTCISCGLHAVAGCGRTAHAACGSVSRCCQHSFSLHCFHKTGVVSYLPGGRCSCWPSLSCQHLLAAVCSAWL